MTNQPAFTQGRYTTERYQCCKIKLSTFGGIDAPLGYMVSLKSIEKNRWLNLVVSFILLAFGLTHEKYFTNMKRFWMNINVQQIYGN